MRREIDGGWREGGGRTTPDDLVEHAAGAHAGLVIHDLGGAILGLALECPRNARDVGWVFELSAVRVLPRSCILSIGLAIVRKFIMADTPSQQMMSLVMFALRVFPGQTRRLYMCGSGGVDLLVKREPRGEYEEG